MSEPAPVVFTEESGFFPAADRLRLYWRSFVPYRPRAVLALVHGYADHSGRYLPTLRHFAGLGYAVHAFDYRGHGQSDGRRGHCDHFSDYLSDLGTFLARVRAEAKDQRLFLVAHSHGALISLRYALEHPTLEEFGGAVLSGAYLKLAFDPPALKVAGARLIGTVIPWLPVKNELETGMLTRDPEVQKATEQDPLYNRTTTPRWFNESNRAQSEVRSRAAEFGWPYLLVHGGADPIASLPAVREFHERTGSSDKELIVYEGFRHEVLDELEHERAWRDIETWVEKRL